MSQKPTAALAKRALSALADPAKAEVLKRFFKTGKGEYGEGDRFRGVVVPAIRRLVSEYSELPHAEVLALLASPWHEDRLLGLLIWVKRFRRAEPAEQRRIYESYLSNTTRINNWDLVDLSAEHVVGAYLCERDRRPLYALARSSLLWDRRIAILATFHYIKLGDPTDTFGLSEVLLGDREDLMHKAVGWMLREVGKRIGLGVEEEFLKPRYRGMPRTMLRYAIERFPETLRRAYLNGEV